MLVGAGWALIVVCCLSGGTRSAAAQAVPGDTGVREFITELRRCVARDDRAAVANLMRYPLEVWAAGVRIPIPDAAALLQHYDAVFSAALEDVIARAEFAREGRPAPAIAVTLTPSGALIHGNTITIDRVGDRLKVTRVSVPLAPASGGHAPGGAARKAAREPRRIAMGLRTVQLSGYLATGERDSYLIWANRNQVLEVRVTGVREREVVAHVVGLKTENPLDARAREGTRTWIGRIPESGEYRIDVVRLAHGAEPLPYGLTMRLH